MDSLLLALLLSKQNKQENDHDDFNDYRDKELKTDSLKWVLRSFIAFVALFAIGSIIEECGYVLLPFLFLIPAGFCFIGFLIVLYMYLKCVIVQWLEL